MYGVTRHWLSFNICNSTELIYLFAQNTNPVSELNVHRYPYIDKPPIIFFFVCFIWFTLNFGVHMKHLVLWYGDALNVLSVIRLRDIISNCSFTMLMVSCWQLLHIHTQLQHIYLLINNILIHDHMETTVSREKIKNPWPSVNITQKRIPIQKTHTHISYSHSLRSTGCQFTAK